MTETAFHQEPEGISTRAIGWTAAGVVVLGIALIAVAWLLVVPPPPADHAVAAPSPLEHGLIDQAAGGDEIRAASAQQLDRYEWIDQKARVVRIPIDRAIDAVVADPQLLAAPLTGAASPAGVVGAAGEAGVAPPAPGAGR